MDKHRRGESGNLPYRSGRFFSVNGNWYFATREGLNQGPFPTRHAAQAALLNFVRERSVALTRARSAAQQLERLEHESGEEAPAAKHSFYW